MTRWAERDDVPRGAVYDERWARLAAEGHGVHGEADLIESLSPSSALDAGCGTGRVAIELARRGVAVVGVDLDESMLAAARAKAPELEWLSGDLATVDVGRRFDVVAMPGNVMIFLSPGTEGQVVANLARHISPGGHLVAGFQLGAGRLSLPAYDDHATAAGLTLLHRWSTWDREPFVDGGDYAVSVHRSA